eukprot:403350569
MKRSSSQQTYQKTESVIKWTGLTGYFIEIVIQGGNKNTLVTNKYVSKNTSENFKQVYASKQLDQFSPIIGGSSLCLRRFKQSQKQLTVAIIIKAQETLDMSRT